MKKRLVIILLIAFVFTLDMAYSQGCSQCKLVAEQGAELDEGSFGNGINKGILLLMTIPYLILFFFFRKSIIRLFKSLFGAKQVS